MHIDFPSDIELMHRGCMLAAEVESALDCVL